MTTYQKFLESKKHTSQNFGIEPTWMPEAAFDFQRYVSEYIIRKGRGAVFLDTGLGKTLIELAVAYNYAQQTKKPVLIITPLAVAFQHIEQAKQFGIDDVEYSKQGKFSAKIVICNYERIHYFNPADFECVILDESSILKNFDGAIKAKITAFLRQVKYRFLFTATPSPNDFTELGTSSEALGYMGYTDMLSKFFTNNENTIDPRHIGTQWRMKGHAEKSFFQWVSSWSISARKPSDLGFSDDRYILPELIKREHVVSNNDPLCINGQMQLFNIVARTRQEIASEERATLINRVEKAAEIGSGSDACVYWGNLNNETDLLVKLIPGAAQVKGSMSIDEKEETLLAFQQGQIKHLVTKAKITSFGLNWQHCAHTVYFPTFSYEQFYQAVRRFWRFGQTRPVTCDIVFSDGAKRIMQSIYEKGKKADSLFSQLNTNLHSTYETKSKDFDKQIIIPSFLK
jgi:hypothetical protein